MLLLKDKKYKRYSLNYGNEDDKELVPFVLYTLNQYKNSFLNEIMPITLVCFNPSLPGGKLPREIQYISLFSVKSKTIQFTLPRMSGIYPHAYRHTDINFHFKI